MAHKTPFKSFKAAIYLTAASMLCAGTAFAQSNVATYDQSQSLPQLSAEQIAADVQANFDPLTGRTEYIARDFDPFEENSQMAGSAVLRSAASGISRDGASIVGGAYLDVSLLYSAASRDPYDAKGYEHAVYLNGQPVDVMTYDVQTLDCQRDVTKVTYDDGYYRGNSYGYVGGMYRLFPRYRGHSHYYNQYDSIRYGSWRGLRHNYNSYRGYDRRHGNQYANRNRHDDRGRSDNNHNDRADNHERRDTQDHDGRNAGSNLSPRVISTRNVIRPDMLGDRRFSEGRSQADRPVKETYTRPVSQPVPRATTTRAWSSSRSTVRTPERRTTITRPHIAQPVTTHTRRSRPDRYNERRMQSAPAESDSRQIRRAAVTPPPRTAPRPVVRSYTAPAPVKRPQTSRNDNRSRSTPSRPVQSRPKSRPKTKPVDRAFKSKNKTSSRPFHYYPGASTQTTTYVDSRCVKEERLSLHIPTERLEAARFDGLSLVLLDREGQDVPVYIPPNYIEGFKRANPYLRQGHHYSPVQPNVNYPQQGG